MIGVRNTVIQETHRNLRAGCINLRVACIVFREDARRAMLARKCILEGNSLTE